MVPQFLPNMLIHFSLGIYTFYSLSRETSDIRSKMQTFLYLGCQDKFSKGLHWMLRQEKELKFYAPV